jgi:hypothetical protein
MKLLYRIHYFFKPNEKAPYTHLENDGEVAVKAGFLAVARQRYPTTFNENTEIKLFGVPPVFPHRKPLAYVGDQAGINARYEIRPVLSANGKYFELTEVKD